MALLRECGCCQERRRPGSCSRKRSTRARGAWAGGARCGVPRGTLPTGSGRAPRPPCGARSRRLPGPDICVLSPEGVEQGPGADEGEGRAQEGSRAGKRGLGKGGRGGETDSRDKEGRGQALERQDQRGESATSLQLAGDKTSRSQQAAVTPLARLGAGRGRLQPTRPAPHLRPGRLPRAGPQPGRSWVSKPQRGMQGGPQSTFWEGGECKHLHPGSSCSQICHNSSKRQK